MSIRRVAFSTGEFYHLYNRGTEKRVIYESDDDHARFQELLYVANSTNAVAIKEIKKQHEIVYEYDRGKNLVAIGAYCLMPNHFHLLVTPLVESGVTKFMGKVMTGYSMYFNKKYERTGALFEGRFKAKHADSDEYLKYLFSYIHLNPVKLIQSDWKEKGIADAEQAYEYASQFRYSSLMDHQQRSRLEAKIIGIEPFPEYFETAALRKAELLEWLSYSAD